MQNVTRITEGIMKSNIIYNTINSSVFTKHDLSSYWEKNWCNKILQLVHEPLEFYYD